MTATDEVAHRADAPATKSLEPPILIDVLLALGAGLLIVVWPAAASLFGVDPTAWDRDIVAALVELVAAGCAGTMALVSARRGRPAARLSTAPGRSRGPSTAARRAGGHTMG